MQKFSPYQIRVGKDDFACVDQADFLFLSSFKWTLQKGGKNKYAYCFRDGKRISMHRLLFDSPKGMEVDHVNGDGLDNRRENLRVCSHAENMRNRGIQKNNHSGFKGVYFDKEKKKWVAKLIFEGKKVLQKRFDSKLEAAKTYREAALFYFGEFAAK